MYAVASVLCKTLQMSFNVDPGVRYFSVGPTISALASAKRGKVENLMRVGGGGEKRPKSWSVSWVKGGSVELN